MKMWNVCWMLTDDGVELKRLKYRYTARRWARGRKVEAAKVCMMKSQRRCETTVGARLTKGLDHVTVLARGIPVVGNRTAASITPRISFGT